MRYVLGVLLPLATVIAVPVADDYPSKPRRFALPLTDAALRWAGAEDPKNRRLERLYRRLT
jgi:hypothetical protein